MLWLHQVRPPGLFDGVALALAEEVLRALQDALSFHQAVPSSDAAAAPDNRFHKKGPSPLAEMARFQRQGLLGYLCLDRDAAVYDEILVEDIVLACRWWLGKRPPDGTFAAGARRLSKFLASSTC